MAKLRLRTTTYTGRRMTETSAGVLIVEDEVLISSLLEGVLSDEGLETKCAYTGSDAVHALRNDGAKLQLLITDIRLGSQPDGWAVAHLAREQNPDIGVIYITGDSMDDWRANGVPESVLITKPFVPAQIVTAAMTLLNRAS